MEVWGFSSLLVCLPVLIPVSNFLFTHVLFLFRVFLLVGQEGWLGEWKNQPNLLWLIFDSRSFPKLVYPYHTFFDVT